MKIVLPQRSAEVRFHTQVLVVGGGPAGIGAAIRAARAGKETLLLEKRGFLGGNITACYVESCNYFMHGTGFSPEGLFNELMEGVKEEFPTTDFRPNSPFRFHSEHLKIFLDRLMRRAGVQVLLHSFVNEVVMEGSRIQAVIIQSKQGPLAVAADTVIDCTGDADVAFSAGVPFSQGRDTDGLCQPGTVNLRLAGVDMDSLLKDGDGLKTLSRKFRADYRAGLLNLSCKRQDLPFGRLTPGGQVSYVNYSCAYGIDPTDVRGLSRGEAECRGYIWEITNYLKENYPGFEKAEIASIAPEIGFRDSRRVRGLYTLTLEDMEGNRQFDDCIAVFPRFYDMLSPDAQMDSTEKVDGRGYHGYIYEPVVDGRSFQVPYRCLLPQGVDNLLVAGRSLSSEHAAQSGLRAITLCMMTGEAAGTAAAFALDQGVAPALVNLAPVQAALKAGGFSLPA